jgi:diguanylate cyclase (GGDEF)-like protein
MGNKKTPPPSSRRRLTDTLLAPDHDGPAEANSPPSGDYARLLAEHEQLQAMFAQQQEMLASLQPTVAADPLTGLANGRTLAAELERSLATARRYGRTHALIVVEVPDFLSLANGLGAGGSAAAPLLQHVARLIRQNIRPTDIAARLEAADGARFAIILNEIRAVENATHRATEIAQTLAHTPCLVGGRMVPLSAITTTRPFGAEDDADSILTATEQALATAQATPPTPAS